MSENKESQSNKNEESDLEDKSDGVISPIMINGYSYYFLSKYFLAKYSLSFRRTKKKLVIQM